MLPTPEWLPGLEGSVLKRGPGTTAGCGREELRWGAKVPATFQLQQPRVEASRAGLMLPWVPGVHTLWLPGSRATVVPP